MPPTILALRRLLAEQHEPTGAVALPWKMEHQLVEEISRMPGNRLHDPKHPGPSFEGVEIIADGAIPEGHIELRPIGWQTPKPDGIDDDRNAYLREIVARLQGMRPDMEMRIQFDHFRYHEPPPPSPLGLLGMDRVVRSLLTVSSPDDLSRKDKRAYDRIEAAEKYRPPHKRLRTYVEEMGLDAREDYRIGGSLFVYRYADPRWRTLPFAPEPLSE